MKISLDNQSAIKIETDKIIYFDTFKLKDEYKDADYIFITHPHYDHFSKSDILKIKKDNTKIISVKDNLDDIISLGFKIEDILIVDVNNEYRIDDITFKTVPAYNINKDFHKKEYGWVGYLLNINNSIVYFVGDSDYVPEMNDIKCDILCVPIGGTYTMDYNEASMLVKKILPNKVIPMHYKTIVGTEEYANIFKREVESITEVDIIME